ncbi:hypothetical protein CPB84DRAFT_263853 [Gymnopilus junonius]|uniref:Uncharacterized protein n=1 Tax=Gymnopilus junonius TaxID=109634 RepID=A0A9P5TI66_GYMJU|nr:hypothetical protein CPB84DRAFT_263853 [Gymnopilus junonius]
MLDIACQRVLEFLGLIAASSPPSSAYFEVSCNQSPLFNLSLDNENGKSRYQIYLWEYPSFSKRLLSHFSSVTSIPNIPEITLYFQSLPPEVIPAFKCVVMPFRSVTWLRASEQTLNFLLESCDPHCLPNLHTLMTSHEKYHEWSRLALKYPYGIVVAFLQHRKAIGLPLSILDISDHPDSWIHDVEPLEHVSCLTIWYVDPATKTVADYVCGRNTLTRSDSY